MKHPSVLKARKRYEKIEGIIKNDETGLGLLIDLVNRATKYNGFLAEMAARIEIKKASMHTEDYLNFTENLSKARISYHDTLIDSLKIFNRYMFTRYEKKTPVGGIYTLDPHSMGNRHAVGEWADYFSMAIEQLNSGKNKRV